MKDMIGKKMVYVKTQEAGVIVTVYPTVQNAFGETYVVWKSDVDNNLYVSKLENIDIV